MGPGQGVGEAMGTAEGAGKGGMEGGLRREGEGFEVRSGGSRVHMTEASVPRRMLEGRCPVVVVEFRVGMEGILTPTVTPMLENSGRLVKTLMNLPKIPT